MELWDHDGRTQADLAESLGVEPPTVTKMLQRMETSTWSTFVPTPSTVGPSCAPHAEGPSPEGQGRQAVGRAGARTCDLSDRQQASLVPPLAARGQPRPPDLAPARRGPPRRRPRIGLRYPSPGEPSRRASHGPPRQGQQSANGSRTAQHTVTKGQWSMDQSQSRKHADGLLRDLGALVYARDTGRAARRPTPTSPGLMTDLQAHEAQGGVVDRPLGRAARPPPLRRRPPPAPLRPPPVPRSAAAPGAPRLRRLRHACAAPAPVAPPPPPVRWRRRPRPAPSGAVHEQVVRADRPMRRVRSGRIGFLRTSSGAVSCCFDRLVAQRSHPERRAGQRSRAAEGKTSRAPKVWATHPIDGPPMGVDR